MLLTSAVLAAVALAPAQAAIKPTDWPQFRGPFRNGFSPETGLLKQWPEAGPPKVWTVSGVGGGYSSVSVVDGVIYGTGSKGGKDHIWARDEATGAEKWSTPFADSKRVGYGEGPRSTPTYANGKVYAVSPGGELACLNAADGVIVWRKNYVSDYDGGVQSWGYSESVLVDEGKVIGTPCSDQAAMVAWDANTGKEVWVAKVPNPGGAGGYASAVKATVGNVPMYINLLGQSGGVVGVHAKTGKVLWKYTKIMNGTANIPSPVVKGNLVFASTGYGAGAALLRLTASAAGVTAQEVKFYRGGELQNHHGGMVLVGDYVYLGNQHNQGKPACVELKTGKILWSENSPFRGDGSAATAAADGMLYFRYQNGVVALIAANPKEFTPVSSFKIPEPSGKPSWPHPAIANGKLFLRDQDKLHCYDLKAGTN